MRGRTNTVNKLIRVLLIAGLFSFSAWSVLGQEISNSETIRQQIKKLKAMVVDGRSASLQNSAIRGWYTQLQVALQREMDDLKKIQAMTAPSDTQTRDEIAKQLQELTSEIAEANTIVAGLGNTPPSVAGSQPA